MRILTNTPSIYSVVTSLHTQENVLLPEQGLSLHPQMTEETLPHKEETVYEPDPKSLLPSLATACFGWSEVKWKTVKTGFQYFVIPQLLFLYTHYTPTFLETRL